jgi:hypothetical protein
MEQEKIKVVAMVDSDMLADADDCPTREDGRTLYVPALTDEEGPPSAELGPEYAALDATRLGLPEERPRVWALFDREGTAAEKAEALAEHLGPAEDGE